MGYKNRLWPVRILLSLALIILMIVPANAASGKVYNEAISYEEYGILYRIVEAEATGEDLQGKILVTNVILNRMDSSDWPNTVSGVVFQPGQFSPISDGRYYSVPVTQSSKDAVHMAVDGTDYSDGAIYFRMRSGSNGSWHERALTRVSEHGCHYFYR